MHRACSRRPSQGAALAPGRGACGVACGAEAACPWPARLLRGESLQVPGWGGAEAPPRHCSRPTERLCQQVPSNWCFLVRVLWGAVVDLSPTRTLMSPSQKHKQDMVTVVKVRKSPRAWVNPASPPSDGARAGGRLCLLGWATCRGRQGPNGPSVRSAQRTVNAQRGVTETPLSKPISRRWKSSLSPGAGQRVCGCTQWTSWPGTGN